MNPEAIEHNPSVVFKPTPKNQLVAIVDVIRQVVARSSGVLTLKEVTEAFSRVYDPDGMMIFDGGQEGLARPVGDDVLGTVGGYNKRIDVASDLSMCRFSDPNSMVSSLGYRQADDFYVLTEDAGVLSEKLLGFFNRGLGTSRVLVIRQESTQPYSQARMAEIGSKGADVRHAGTRGAKRWAVENMRSSSMDEAKRLHAAMPRVLYLQLDTLKDPVRVIYNAIRNADKEERDRLLDTSGTP